MTNHEHPPAEIVFQYTSERRTTEPSIEERRRDRVEGLLICTGLVAVFGLLFALGARAYHDGDQWEKRAPVVQRLLNDRYTEDVQYDRMFGGRYQEETLVLDGRLRKDCQVTGEDTDPRIACFDKTRRAFVILKDGS